MSDTNGAATPVEPADTLLDHLRVRQVRPNTSSWFSSRACSHPKAKSSGTISAQRAAQAVRRVRGVRSVCNLIVLESKLPPTEFKREIEAAFRRNAKLDTNQIGVQAEGSNVTLRGTLRSWAAREVAERVTWTTPGVARVDNQT
jgi:osmotically-inducible protein OsmY